MTTFTDLSTQLRSIATGMTAAVEAEYLELAKDIIRVGGLDGKTFSEISPAAMEEMARELREEAIEQMLHNTSTWSGGGAQINNFEETIKRDVAQRLVRNGCRSMIINAILALSEK